MMTSHVDKLNPGLDRRRAPVAGFFHQRNWDAEIACLESCLSPGDKPLYAPVLSGPYLMSKFQATVKPAA